MLVGTLCKKDVDLIESRQTVHEAASRMLQRGVGSLVIINAAREPVGIVTDRDLVARVLASGKNPLETRIADVMTSNPEVVREDADLADALGRMRDGPYRRPPVVNQTGKLAGIVTLDDVQMRLMETIKDSFRTVCGHLDQVRSVLVGQVRSTDSR